MNNFTKNENGGLVYMTADIIKTRHAFTTRLGGVSEGIFESLNLGENRGDDPERVRRNYEIICAALGCDYKDVVFTKQVHGNEVRIVTSSDRHTLFTPVPYEADGLITNEKGVPLIVFSADCTPIIFHDPVNGVIAAVHAGWRGTVQNIVGVAVEKMVKNFGCDVKNITVAIGPCISKCCFETGAEVPEAMQSCAPDIAEKFYYEKPDGKFMCDLKGFNRGLIMKAGIQAKNISVSGECTKCRHKKYWSHRHTNGERGSQATIIVM